MPVPVNVDVMDAYLPQMDPLTLLIDGEKGPSSSVSGPCISGKVCNNDKMEGVDCGEAAARWIQEATGAERVRLVRQSDTDDR